MPNQPVVLVAENDVSVQNIARLVLEMDGYVVLTACDGEEALTISGQYRGTIDALLTGMRMPGLDGLQLAERIAVQRPSVRIMIMSGQMEDPFIKGITFLQKPFGPLLLKRRMRELLSETLTT